MDIRGEISTPLGQRLSRARVGSLPLLVWIGGVFLALDLWLDEPRTSTYHGLAHVDEVAVSCPVDGQLVRLLIGLYDTVQAGDPLATLDDAGLLARIETARAELGQLAAELEAQRARLEFEDQIARAEVSATARLEYPAELRAFHADEARLELELLQTRLDIATSELRADRFEVEVHRFETLVRQEIATPAETEDLVLQHEIERQRIEGLRRIETDLLADLDDARARRRALASGYQAPAGGIFAPAGLEARLSGWKAALVVQQKRLDELDLLRRAHVLRAPVSGRVATLMADEGRYLLAGETVLLLVDPETTAVALWLPEATRVQPRLGDRFVVTHQLDPRDEVQAECFVQAVGPRMEVMPQRLWRDARVAEYGRSCLIGPVAALELVPGERVRIDPYPSARP